MRRDDDIERRLLEWARWRDMGRGGGMGLARVNLLEPRNTSGYREAIIPTSAVDAAITDDGVVALDSPLRAAVEAWYLREGSATRSAAACAAGRLAISEATMHKRVALAHRALKAWLAERAARLREREALDAAIRQAARP